MTLSNTPPDSGLSESPLTGTILVVDDSQDARRASVDVLELEGFSTLDADNGLTALELVDEHGPDLILLDVKMPGMSGIEVLQAIRARPDQAETPVILVTMLDAPEDVVYGLELGANDYLTKPVQSEILIARVRTQLRLKRLRDQRRRDVIRLAELDSVKNKFLQIAAHDLKNPISNMLIGLDLLEPYSASFEQVAPDFHDIFGAMKAAANSMLVLVGDFLDHQAIHSGQIQLDIQAVSLNRIMEKVVEQFRPTADQKGIALSLEIDGALGDIQADPNRLMQVASNLIGNALKFTRSGGSVAVRTQAVNEVQRVEVEDTGPGIRDEDLDMLFQDFTRLENKPTGGEKSSGLGLSIARQLIELQGGRIGVESQLGKGSTFWFELPG